MPERGLWFWMRCLLCETLFGWARKVAPDGYVPSYIEAGMRLYKQGMADVLAARRKEAQP